MVATSVQTHTISLQPVTPSSTVYVCCHGYNKISDAVIHLLKLGTDMVVGWAPIVEDNLFL
jgi:hypothetical protein